MIKLTINGFDIEIVENDTEISVKILDASGKELSNNMYMQSKDGETTEDNELESPEITDDTTTEEVEADVDDLDELSNLDEDTDVSDEDEDEDEEVLAESYIIESIDEFVKNIKE